MTISDETIKELERLKRGFAREDQTIIDGEIGDLLETHGGRKFLWWLLELGGIGRNPYTSNALNTSFNCGEMNVSQRILARLLEVNAAGYAQLIQENADDHARREQLLAGVRDGTDDAAG